MIQTVRPEAQSEFPIKVFKRLLIFAVGRLAALGDEEGLEWIMAELPPEEKKGEQS